MSLSQGKPYSLMCAYNRYNGEAACGSEFLLQDILRKDWKFDGFIVTDCGAVADMHEHHKVSDTPAQSAALAVKSGSDLNCGKVYSSLIEAHQQGLIDESTIDQAVKRLFLARMKLGMFDPVAKVPYAQIPYSVVDSPEHRQLAVEAARKSIVLLKNENNLLPLSKDIKKLAVIGPNSDQWLMLLGNYNGLPAEPITPLQGLKRKLPEVEINYAQGSELADGIPLLQTIPKRVLFTQLGEPGLNAEFFNNAQFQGESVFSQHFDNIDVSWQDKAPRPDMDDDDFSVHWSGILKPEVSGRYQLGIISTCNTKLFLDGQEVVNTAYHFRDEYGDPRTKKSDWIELEAGKEYEFSVKAAETYADAQVQIVWSEPQSQLREDALAIAKQADAVLMFMGLTARMEGEEMNIEVPGFRGGDRTDIELPQVQKQLIQEIQATGKPVVLVLLNGSALAINWADQNVPAIIEAWYPGQAGGDAIADVIFGDYNPAGRLPLTFYNSLENLPDFDDYSISNQTYRYYSGPVLYPFGYGLSYSQFHYRNLKIKKHLSMDEVKSADLYSAAVDLEVEVQNLSSRDGEEVVQVYLKNLHPSLDQPKLLRSLVAFDRVMIKAGQSKKVTLSIPRWAFAQFDQEGQRQWAAGEFAVFVGGSQPEQEKTSSNILSSRIKLGQ